MLRSSHSLHSILTVKCLSFYQLSFVLIFIAHFLYVPMATITSKQFYSYIHLYVLQLTYFIINFHQICSTVVFFLCMFHQHNHLYFQLNVITLMHSRGSFRLQVDFYMTCNPLHIICLKLNLRYTYTVEPRG